MPLTFTAIEAARPRDKQYKLSDGYGLSLYVQPNGSKWWRINYRFLGKQKTLSLGTYPAVSLAQARARTQAIKKELAQGVDPSQARKESVAAARITDGNTFKYIAGLWKEEWKSGKSARHQKKVDRWLEFYLYPDLGVIPIVKITAPLILKVIDPVKKQGKRETAHRLIQTLGMIFRYAIQNGYASVNPTPDLKGAIPPPEVKNMASIKKPHELGALLRAIDAYQGSIAVKAALKISPLIFQRPGEIRHMRWSELDFENGFWTFWVTKNKKEQIVPLPRQALEILTELKEFTGHLEFVFPNGHDPKRPMSENAINAALRRMGYDTQNEITAHGFRGTAQTIGQGELGFNKVIMEKQLSHEPIGPLGSTYDKAEYLQQRADMLQQWADHLDQLKRAGDSRK